MQLKLGNALLIKLLFISCNLLFICHLGSTCCLRVRL